MTELDLDHYVPRSLRRPYHDAPCLNDCGKEVAYVDDAMAIALLVHGHSELFLGYRPLHLHPYVENSVVICAGSPYWLGVIHTPDPAAGSVAQQAQAMYRALERFAGYVADQYDGFIS